MTKLTPDEQFRVVEFIVRARTEHPRWSMTRLTATLHDEQPDLAHVTWHDLRYYFDTKIAPHLNAERDNYAALDPEQLLPRSRRLRDRAQGATGNIAPLVARVQRLIDRHEQIQTALSERSQETERLQAEDRQVQAELTQLRDALSGPFAEVLAALEHLTPAPADEDAVDADPPVLVR